MNGAWRQWDKLVVIKLLMMESLKSQYNMYTKRLCIFTVATKRTPTIDLTCSSLLLFTHTICKLF